MDQVPSQPVAGTPLVSVVVPTCNRRAVLQRCVEALVRQTHPRYEIIIVDDGSTDDTPRFMEQFIADHPDKTIRYLRNETNLGANPSRNRGIREATGAFVAFEDSDCVAEPDWLKRLTAPFENDRVASVVGLVKDPAPTNIFELSFKGTHRVVGPKANRLVGCNMCVRRDRLLECMLDEDRATQARHADGTIDVTVSGRGDEEGLYLMLRAAGYEQVTAPDAVVLHEHYYTARSFFKQAFRGGRSAARLVYKFHLPTRLDMLPFILTYVTLPLVLIRGWLVVVPAFFFAGALAAITYNDLVRKGKTVWETLVSFPVLLAYYHVRLAGYVIEALRLRFGKHDVTRRRLTGA
jgi:glycosyltransferase involved in cell wall biosynthesis